MPNAVFKGSVGIPKFNDLQECPYCGSKTFYVRQHAEGTIVFRFCPDGSEADNEDMYSALITSEGIKVYCDDCQKYLGNRKNGKISSGAFKELIKKEGDKNDKG